MTFSRHYLAQRATLNAVNLAEVQGCRRAHNQLGFAYQVGFVRLLNRFPKQEPFEVLDELLLFTGMQLGVDSTLIEEYRRPPSDDLRAPAADRTLPRSLSLRRHGIELSLLRHVSPIEWDNIVLYGEYALNRRLVRRSRSRS